MITLSHFRYRVSSLKMGQGIFLRNALLGPLAVRRTGRGGGSGLGEGMSGMSIVGVVPPLLPSIITFGMGRSLSEVGDMTTAPARVELEEAVGDDEERYKGM